MELWVLPACPCCAAATRPGSGPYNIAVVVLVLAAIKVHPIYLGHPQTPLNNFSLL